MAASRRVLLGMVPVLTQTPPRMRSRSQIAARRPSLAAWIAACLPGRPGADHQQVEVVLGHAAQAAAPSDASEPETSWAASESSAMRCPLSVYGETTLSAPTRVSLDTDSGSDARATMVSRG